MDIPCQCWREQEENCWSCMARRAPPVPPPWGAQGVWGHPGTLRGAGLWQELPPSQGHCDLLWHRDGNWVRAQESALQDGPEAKGNLFCVLSSLLCLSRQGRGAGCCLAFFDVVLALILIREREFLKINYWRISLRCTLTPSPSPSGVLFHPDS